MARFTCLLPAFFNELANGLACFGACVCLPEEVRHEH